MRQVAAIVFVAHIFHGLLSSGPRNGVACGPGFGVGVRVFYRHLIVQRRFVCTLDALHSMQGLCVRMAILIEPTAVVESDRVDHQRVTFPTTDGIAEPTWIGI